MRLRADRTGEVPRLLGECRFAAGNEFIGHNGPPVSDLTIHSHRPHNRHGLPECQKTSPNLAFPRVILEFGESMLDFRTADLDPPAAKFQLCIADLWSVAGFLQSGIAIV